MKRSLKLQPLLFVALLLTPGESNISVQISKELITESPPWPYSHVCTLSEKKNGDVVTTWQAGTSEKNPDSSIWTATRTEATGNITD